ncbi:hypothetical protein D3C85_1892630 [compost metagenome]
MIEDANSSISGKIDIKILSTTLARYDQLWNEWRELKESSKECATIYTDLAFKNKKSGSIGEFVEKLKFKVGR